MDNNILVVDDELDFLDSVRRGLISSGFKNVQLENDSNSAAALFQEGSSFDLALLDVRIPGVSGVELLELIKKTSPSTECVMVTAMNEARIATECLKKGAYDYLVKPFSRDDLVEIVKHVLKRKRVHDILCQEKKTTVPQLANIEAFKPIVTRSAKVIKILKEAELHAASDIPVLITGESGVGKELLARAIHRSSPRRRFPFTPVNMASLTDTLFNTEFFGHTRGAFTGAERDHMGFLSQTNKGTLFLDEIGNFPVQLQGKLLRVLEEGEYFKLGSSKSQKTDVRFVSATNANLKRLVQKNMFREDLYFRIKGACLHLPPLRKRKEDIPLLIDNFLKEFSDSSGDCGIQEEAIQTLMCYDYPGNIRELKYIVQLALNVAQGRPISVNSLPQYLRMQKPISKANAQTEESLVTPLWEVEKAHILKVYEQMGENKTQTARLLGIGLNTLRRKLEALGVK
jgi:DNA-binding NtrC family response regulator